MNHTSSATAVNQTVSSSNISNANGTSLYPHFNQSKILIWTVVTLCLSAVGCFNNILVLYATWPRRRHKSGVNLLIFHYVAVNLLMCLIHNPIRCILVQAKQHGYPVPVQVCYYVQTIVSVVWVALFWADAALAFNRCIALFFPHLYRTYSTTRNNLLQIALIWTVSTAVVLPANFGVEGFMTVLPIGHCAYRATKTQYGKFYEIFKQLPYIVTGVASALILWKCYLLGRTSTAVSDVDRTGSGGSARIRHRILMAKMLVLTYAWTVVCVIPSTVITNLYPSVLQNDPLANVWMSTAVVAQYGFIACILLISNAGYREKLRLIAKKVLPAESSVSHTNQSVSATVKMSDKTSAKDRRGN